VTLRPTVVVGIGEMGSVFSRAFLRAGRTVVPILRDTDVASVAGTLPEPELVLVAVGEADLPDVLDQIPEPWRGRLLLIQNELLPRTWRAHSVDRPTVAPVWFEKKPGRPVTVIVPTPIAGPGAAFTAAALAGLDIPAEVVTDDEILGRLVAKNLYILTANIAGLAVGGTVGELWAAHRDLAEAVAGEVLAIQRRLAAAPFDEHAALAEMRRAVAADPDHLATGRSAPARLARALRHAERLGAPTPTLRLIRDASPGPA